MMTATDLLYFTAEQQKSFSLSHASKCVERCVNDGYATDTAERYNSASSIIYTDKTDQLAGKNNFHIWLNQRHIVFLLVLFFLL